MKGNIVIALALIGACSSCDEAQQTAERIPEPERESTPEPDETAEPTPGDAICERWTGDWCVPAGLGAWWLEREAEPVDCGMGNIPESGHSGRLRIGYSTGDTRVAGDWESFDDCSSNVEYTALAHCDWDGDGHEELALRRSEGYLDGGETRAWIQRFADGAIGMLPSLPSEAGEVFEVRDEDWDGRLDIVTRGPHMRGPFETDCCSNVYSGGPSTLWHSLPDGSFSRSDEVARTHLREMCGDTQAPIARSALEALAECYGDEAWDDIHVRVTCARLGGDTVARIRQRVQHEVDAFECPADAGCCSELDGLADDAARLAERVDIAVTLE